MVTFTTTGDPLSFRFERRSGRDEALDGKRNDPFVTLMSTSMDYHVDFFIGRFPRVSEGGQERMGGETLSSLLDDKEKRGWGSFSYTTRFC